MGKVSERLQAMQNLWQTQQQKADALCAFFAKKSAAVQSAAEKVLLSLAKGTASVRSFLQGIWDACRAPEEKTAAICAVFGIDVHKKVTLGAAVRVAFPLAAVLLLAGTVRYWNTRTFALNVVVDGQAIVTVEKEAVYESANVRLSNQVSHENEGVTYYTTPMYAITLKENAVVSNADRAYDSLLQQTSGVLEQACGLYRNGELIAVMAEQDALETALKEYSSQYTGKEEAFVQEITLVNGLYAAQSVLSAQTFSEKLFAGEFGLDVTYSSLVVRQEILPFGTDEVKDDTQYTDYRVPVSNGVDGLLECTDRLVYVNGVLEQTETVSTEVVTAPVNEVVVQGTAIRPDGSQPGVASGILAWPSDNMFVITTLHTYRWGFFHYGIDLWCQDCYGEPILAADAGKVIWAGNNGNGYGYYLIVDHGNGIQTLYAHCSRLAVGDGDLVTKGQVIGYVGVSGYVTGAHLHFEVLDHGVSLNPLHYLPDVDYEYIPY